MQDKLKQRHSYRERLLDFARAWPWQPDHWRRVFTLHTPGCTAFQPGGACNCSAELKPGQPGSVR